MVPSEEALLFLEASAVVLNIGFTLCIAYEKRMGWLLGFVAGVIGVGLYALANTWAMSALNGYYVVMAVYGWWSWGEVQRKVTSDPALAFPCAAIPVGLMLSYGVSVALVKYPMAASRSWTPLSPYSASWPRG